MTSSSGLTGPATSTNVAYEMSPISKPTVPVVSFPQSQSGEGEGEYVIPSLPEISATPAVHPPAKVPS